jgi:hypothetical protein
LQKHLRAFADTVAPVKEELPPKKKKKQNKNNPHFRLADELQRITGVDLTRIDGVDVMVAQTVISEVGLDMSRWKTEAHFASWLGLCPDNRISGDKVLARPQSHHGDGSSVGPTGLSNAEVWSALRRQRCGILPTKKPPATNRVPQEESSPTRPTGHPSSCLNYQSRSFWISCVAAGLLPTAILLGFLKIPHHAVKKRSLLIVSPQLFFSAKLFFTRAWHQMSV